MSAKIIILNISSLYLPVTIIICVFGRIVTYYSKALEGVTVAFLDYFYVSTNPIEVFLGELHFEYQAFPVPKN